MPDKETFVAQANVEHYRRLLQTEKDDAKRATIERLLSEAEQKLEDLQRGG